MTSPKHAEAVGAGPRAPLAEAAGHCAELAKELARLDGDSVEAEALHTAAAYFCTLCVAGRAAVRRAKRVDVLVVDEAAQCVEAETCVALQTQPRRGCVLVGDFRQLSAVVASPAAARAGSPAHNERNCTLPRCTPKLGRQGPSG